MANAQKPEEDRAKLADIATRIGITGLLALEGLARVDIGSSGVPTVTNGALVVVSLVIAVF